MEYIIIFTNKTICEDKEFGTFNISADNVLERIIIGSDKMFIIAYDSITENQLDKLADIITGGPVYILYHSTPEEAIRSLLTERLEKKAVQVIFHESNHAQPAYGQLKCIRESENEPQQLKKVFDELKGQIYLLPTLIQLHKILVLEHLKGEVGEDSMIEKLKKGEFAKLKNAYDFEKELKEGGVKKILDHISNEVVKYGA